MNVLNNIWIAISTSNETLVNILTIPTALLFEAPLTYFLISTTFNLSPSKLKKYLYILITTTIAILATFVIKWPYNVIFNYIFSIIIIYFIFKMNIIKTLIASIVPGIIFNLVGIITLNPYTKLLKISYTQATTIPIYRFPYTFIMYFIVLIIVFILKYRKIAFNILDNLERKSKTIIILNFLFGFLNLGIQVLLTGEYIDVLPVYYSFFNFISLTIFFSLSFYSLAKIMKLLTTTQKLETTEEHNKTLQILHDNVRGFKHDFDNIITTIGGFIKTDDMEGLKKYYSQLEKDCKSVNNLYILNPEIINNPGVYILLATKYSEAEEKDIKVDINYLLDLKKLNMKIYEFTRILGILLDNAIEAASESDEKKLNIIFRDDSNNHRNIIQIENTYKNKEVNIDNIFNKGVSGKENHSGLGLWETRQIISKNNNINLHTSKDDSYFSQQLEIYY